MMKTKSPVHIRFDALDFIWHSVPEKKIDNYLKMRNIQADADNYVVDGFPYMLQVEPTNMCNLKCPLCPAGTNQLERPRRHMPLQEFKGLVDDMEDYLLFLILWEWGEPFMHPQLPEIIRYAADRDIKTLTSTNAHFLDDAQYLERILTSGLTTLIVAIDSLEQERYSIYRKNGSLSKAVAGLKKVVRLKKGLSPKHGLICAW
jgi:MoaA/NifB/PqqE/SkfB family radical SAM enzyme